MPYYPFNPHLGQIMQGAVDSGLTVDRGFLAHMTWGSPVVADGTAIISGSVVGTAAASTITSGIPTLDYARALSVKGDGTAAVGTISITGLDIQGSAITDTIVLNGTAVVAGDMAFASIGTIVIPAMSGTAGTAVGISVGFTDLLGLPHALAANTVLAAALAGVREATAPTVAVNSGTVALNTVDLNSALDGSLVDTWYIV